MWCDRIGALFEPYRRHLILGNSAKEQHLSKQSTPFQTILNPKKSIQKSSPKSKQVSTFNISHYLKKCHTSISWPQKITNNQTNIHEKGTKNKSWSESCSKCSVWIGIHFLRLNRFQTLNAMNPTVPSHFYMSLFFRLICKVVSQLNCVYNLYNNGDYGEFSLPQSHSCVWVFVCMIMFVLPINRPPLYMWWYKRTYVAFTKGFTLIDGTAGYRNEFVFELSIPTLTTIYVRYQNGGGKIDQWLTSDLTDLHFDKQGVMRDCFRCIALRNIDRHWSNFFAEITGW